ncbi:lipid-A-disaccharide synthase [Skermanella stibiiresistens SB22]|uniref:Lipid-A-disaccharide synthase n=1 Tax=Skermanella stibiiresistens SB22 TaxID=1385369 RepID=W9HBQ7_9PROT|nr:lipid-A-disaccharide synthase [Skermanella stibiiresistens]EWY42151.1 lipid-A-disaccharide synthase [Skermanella stibiiresistens SB22]
MRERGPLIFLVAGEPSGDLLGARLMAALKRQSDGLIRFAGVGGERMIAEGLDTLFPLSDLSLMGIAELVPRLPNLIRRLSQTTEEIRRLRPDVVVTIDAPDFCFRVAKRLKGQGIPFVHYVAPSVWAWRPGRARKIARILDHLLALLPFEPPYFEKEGLPCTFVGHPIVEGGAASGDGARFREKHGLAPADRVLTVLPGSRRGEISRLLPDFGATVARLAPRYPGLVVAVPTVPHVRDTVAAAVAGWPVRTVLVEGDADKYDAFAASEAALAASGTVALELALARLPAVIAYRMHPVTLGLYRRFIYAKYANLVNIMLDRMLVPELLQEDCTPEKLDAAITRLLDDHSARVEQQTGVAEVAKWLGVGGVPPSDRAAEVVLGIVKGTTRRGQ